MAHDEQGDNRAGVRHRYPTITSGAQPGGRRGGLWAVGTSGTWVTVESPISCAEAKPGQSRLASHHTAWEVQTQKWALENLLKCPRMM